MSKSNNNLSQSKRNVLKTESLVNMIFNALNFQDKLNFSLCCKKLYSFFQNRDKILKTNIEIPHIHHIKEIETSLLKNILSKYKSIKEIETSFNDEKLKILTKAKLIYLEKLRFDGISSNIGLFMNMINIKQLYLEWTESKSFDLGLLNLSFLSNLSNLEILKLSHCEIEDIEPIKGLIKLKEFSMNNVSKKSENIEQDYSNISPQDLENFEIPDFYFFRKPLFDISPISNCFNLEKLEFRETELNSIEPISKLINLKELNLFHLSQQIDILHLLNLKNLKSLSIRSTSIINIDSIKYLVNLEKLDKSWNFHSDIIFISCLNNLKILNLTRNSITNIEPIKNLKNIEVLILKGNINLEDISPLSNMVNLKILNLSETKVSNISPIKYLK